MAGGVSRHKLRHREGSKIAPKHARGFMSRASARNDAEAIHAAAGAQDCFPLGFPRTEIGRLRCDGDGLLIGETRPPARGRDRAQAPID